MRSRVLILVVLGAIFVGAVLAAVRYGGEMVFTPPAEEEELGPIATGQTVGAAHAAVAGDSTGWPNLFGPTHDGVAPGPTPAIEPWGEEGPREVWRIACGSGYSSPIVFDDKLVLMHRLGDEEIVDCLKADDASPVWEHRYPTTFECQSHYTHGPYSTPSTDGERVYTIGAEGQLHCLDATDGSVVWQKNLDAEYGVRHDVFGVGHSPLIWREKLILNVGGEKPGTGVVALDKRTGDVLWEAVDHAGASYATPQPARIHDEDHLFVLTAVGLVSVDPDDGTVRWSIPYATQILDNYNAVTPVVYGDLVFVSVFGQGAMVLRVLEDGSHEPVWDNGRVLTSHYTPVVPVDGKLYGVHTNDKSLRCVDMATGEVLWRWRSPLKRSTQIAVGDRLVVVGEHSRLGLVDLDPEEFVERSVAKEGLFAGESLYSAPAYANGRLYVRSETEAVCLELGNR